VPRQLEGGGAQRRPGAPRPHSAHSMKRSKHASFTPLSRCTSHIFIAFQQLQGKPASAPRAVSRLPHSDGEGAAGLLRRSDTFRWCASAVRRAPGCEICAIGFSKQQRRPGRWPGRRRHRCRSRRHCCKAPLSSTHSVKHMLMHRFGDCPPALWVHLCEGPMVGATGGRRDVLLCRTTVPVYRWCS
jgi:hypothetical protein